MLIIEVTNAEINVGIAGSIWKCPVALAIGKVVGRNNCSCSNTRIRIGTNMFEGPPEMDAFIKLFDSGKEVKPFTFTIDETKPLFSTETI